MSKQIKRKKTDNAHVGIKVAVRQEAIANLTDGVRVLDCFCGNNVLWKSVCASCPVPGAQAQGFPDVYLGLEKVNGKGSRNIHGDNLRLIPSLDLSRYNVIDLDAYGIPGAQLIALLQNKTLPDKVVVVYTAITNAVSCGQKKMIQAAGVPYEAYRKCPTLWNKKMLDLWYFVLLKIGVEKVFRVVVNESSYEKHYGYFVLNKKPINDIIHMLR